MSDETMRDPPWELGPFTVGEVVVLTVDCPSLHKRAGDEVTIAGPYARHWALHYREMRHVWGWLLNEVTTPEFRAWGLRRVLAQYGEVRRRRRPDPVERLRRGLSVACPPPEVSCRCSSGALMLPVLP